LYYLQLHNDDVKMVRKIFNQYSDSCDNGHLWDQRVAGYCSLY
jgi:hypothetical protein